MDTFLFTRGLSGDFWMFKIYQVPFTNRNLSKSAWSSSHLSCKLHRLETTHKKIFMGPWLSCGDPAISEKDLITQAQRQKHVKEGCFSSLFPKWPESMSFIIILITMSFFESNDRFDAVQFQKYLHINYGPLLCMVINKTGILPSKSLTSFLI